MSKKIAVVIALIISFVVVVIFSSLLTDKYQKLTALRHIQKKLSQADILAKAIHELQKERGISSGYIASSAKNFSQELQEQRKLTDRALLALQRDTREDLSSLRDRVDTLSLSVQENISTYSSITDKYLNSIHTIATLSAIPEVTKEILAYSNFLFAKESAGRERAVGTALLSDREIFERERVVFIKLIAMQDIYIKKFLSFTDSEDLDKYNLLTESESFQDVDAMRKSIIEAREYKSLHVSPSKWLKTVTSKIDRLKNYSAYLMRTIKLSVKLSYNYTKSTLIFYLFSDIISLVVLFFILRRLLLELQEERKKRMLIEKYVINSTTDTRGRITYVSEAFCNISGYTKEELIGKNHNIVRHPDTPKKTFRELWKTIQAGNIWAGRLQNRAKDGTSYWVYATIEPTYNERGLLSGYAAVRIDITQSIDLELRIERELEKNRQKDQAMLQQSKLAQMGEMISMIAHQWRQPLSAISATSASLSLKAQLGTLESEITKNAADNISQYAQHLSSTIDDFRNFFKENKTAEKTTLKTMLDSTLEIVKISLDNQKIEVEIVQKEETEIETYVNEVKQVILNIIKNAEDILIEKEIQNPKITITIEDATLTIADNAGGIPKEIEDKIFEPYFSTKIKKDGTGLGLYMSKTIIEDHCDGTLSVTNDEQGAVFCINLNKSRG